MADSMREKRSAPEANLDAKIKFRISDDGLRLYVVGYSPPQGTGQALSRATFEQALVNQGIQLPMNRENAREIIRRILQGKSYDHIILVEGTNSREAQDARLVRLGRPEYPVFPDDVFAKRIPPIPPRVGKTVMGKEILPTKSKQPKDIVAKAGSNADFIESSQSFIAKAYGLVGFNGKENEFFITPTMSVSKKRLKVTATIYSRDYFNKPVTTDRLRNALKKLNIQARVNISDVAEAMNKARKADNPIPGIVVARGRDKIDGHDGWAETLVTKRSAVGSETEDGSINYRERGLFPSTAPGEEILRLHPSRSGTDGIDVFGEIIKAYEGRDLKLKAGENVELAPDGITFRAMTEGLVVLAPDKISITESISIAGDVCMKTGNVRTKNGSVYVSGSVEAGFTVESPEHIFIGGLVESAKLIAEEHIEIAGGLLMLGEGYVKAGGNITAKFANNASITAGGDIEISGEVSNCTIKTQRRFFAKGAKGSVQGGKITAEKGMDIQSVGSELGVATELELIAEIPNELPRLREERSELNQKVVQMDKALAGIDVLSVLRNTDHADHGRISQIVRARQVMGTKRDELAKAIQGEYEKWRQRLAELRIVIRGTAYPGTVITIGEATTNLTEEYKSGIFQMSEETKSIVFQSNTK
ncbi:MAG: FapA family protein [Desulfovibrio sp.]